MRGPGGGGHLARWAASLSLPPTTATPSRWLDEDGEPFTAHTTNLVPFYIVGGAASELRDGRLADIAPTMLDLMGLEKPKEMDGETLIVN